MRICAVSRVVRVRVGRIREKADDDDDGPEGTPSFMNYRGGAMYLCDLGTPPPNWRLSLLAPKRPPWAGSRHGTPADASESPAKGCQQQVPAGCPEAPT